MAMGFLPVTAKEMRALGWDGKSTTRKVFVFR